MGNISSRIDDGGALYLKDQARLSIASLTVSNARRRVLLNITPNAYPGTRISVKRDPGDDLPIEFVQDPEPPASASIPSFLLRLNNDDELLFKFIFVIRQAAAKETSNPPVGGITTVNPGVDATINGLTFAYASNSKDLDNLVTREFHADPNLHKNSNVQLVGDKYTTDGSPSVQFEWSWKWRQPKVPEDKGGGWRNCCSFLEYDQRAHRLNTLASFTFWVHNTQRPLISPQLPSPGFDLVVPPRLRVPSSQSMISRQSDSEGAQNEPLEPPSPAEPAAENGAGVAHTLSNSSTKVDVMCQRPGEDMSAVEDGPLFRATMKALEQKTGNMRTKMKKVLKKAEAAQQAQADCNEAMAAFTSALREASVSNANAIQPALEHYFEKIARQILLYEKQNTVNLQKLIIEPISRLYNYDIKQAEAKKKDFEDESRDYYAYLSRYLGQRQDSLKEKKRVESDSKYQSKRRNFELRRFDYSSFMQDLHGGRKEQEVLSHLTKYADTQTKGYMATAKKIEDMLPQLDALIQEVRTADREFQFQRTEREEKRRTLEKSTKNYTEPEPSTTSSMPPSNQINSNGGSYFSDSELGRSDSTGSQLKGATNGTLGPITSNTSTLSTQQSNTLSATSGHSLGASPGSNKFKGIRDLEEKDFSQLAITGKAAGQLRKEGLLWALSRPGSHIDPKGINKQAWHKFWIVLDQGKLSEYSNWKQTLEQHMEPIDLRMASVREARTAERRFCFEVITPQYKRIYQATSEEDMNSWITAINNALQSAVEGRGMSQSIPPSSRGEGSIGRDIGSVLTGKTSSHAGQHHHSNVSNTSGINRRTTVGARPTYVRTDSNSFEENPTKLLDIIRNADQGNQWCADCGSGSKVEWVSINLGIILCIECSGIHRSLGTHISKVRSLTLDINSFSTDIVEILLQIGNRVSNMIWEATLSQSQSQSLKPTYQSSRDQRLKFITAKYAERAFVQPISSTQSHYATPDETLLASIKKNDIQGVLYAVALHANLNTHDRSRNTHTVFLALAAADPAGGPASSPAVSPNSKTNASSAKVVSFPVAELLVQNGAEIPTQLPSIPLSPAAKLYIDQKTGKDGSGGDTLGALPTIQGGANGLTRGGTVGERDKDRDREGKLQKRGSAGARFAGKVGGFGV